MSVKDHVKVFNEYGLDENSACSIIAEALTSKNGLVSVKLNGSIVYVTSNLNIRRNTKTKATVCSKLSKAFKAYLKEI